MGRNEQSVAPDRPWFVWIVSSLACVAICVLFWLVIHDRGASDPGLRLPPLPDLTDASSALRRQLTGADGAARRAPGSGEAVGNLAIAYHANAFDERARVAYRLAMGNEPKVFRWPYFLGVLEMGSGRNESARRRLDLAVKLNAGISHAWVRLGQLRFRAGLTDQAEQAFRTALTLAPDHPHAAVELARVLELREAWSEVATLLSRTVKTNQRFGSAHRYLAIAYDRLGETAKARRHEGIGTEVQINDELINDLYAQSSTASILVTRATIAETWGDYSRAELLLRRAVAVAPDDRDARLVLGRILVTHAPTDRTSLEDAKKHLEVALSLDPTYALTRYYFGIALKGLGDTEAAVAQWQRILREEPEHGPTLMMLGQLRFQAADFEQAFELLGRGLAVPLDTPFMVGNRAAGWYLVGRAAQNTGRTDEAIDAFGQAIQEDPRRTEAYGDAARLLRKVGRGDEAIGLVRRGVEFSPASAELRLVLGNLLLQGKRFDEARGELSQSLRLKPGDVRTLSAAGFVELQLGNVDTAIEHLRAALRVNPNFHLAHFHLGNALLQTGKRDDAVKHFETAIRLRPSFEPARRALAELE